eukprot:TRINITY_DN8810_c0_g1_i1.p1 TRINITY_DN8810_c0_g1~~TRINITY_DN8810_c0_g1_i1.p1  ORF type:complete len:748 (+),score=249.22 TRINITY_DN8810_c0_g1_i1:40-2283(+)
MSVNELNEKLKSQPYLSGYQPGKEDAEMFSKLMGGAGRGVQEWVQRMVMYSPDARKAVLQAGNDVKPAAAAPKQEKAKEGKKEVQKPVAHVDAQEPSPVIGSNFLRELIKEDLKKGNRCGNRKTKGDIVRTRFPPEPNGYLHIGHAKSICLNFGLAKEFNGRCHLRFDDTNPASEKQEYIDAIQEDVKWLGYDWGEHLYYASSYFPQLYEWAVHMIKNGDAYVDSQTRDQIAANRGSLTKPGVNSPFRDRPVEENLRLFEEMKDGKHPEGSLVLRAKIDMASPNMNMRDPLMYRILFKEHPHTGNKWVIYPIYDFAHGQEDAIEGITHSFCTLEFDAHRPLYEWFLDHLPLPAGERPIQTEFARLNITGTRLSKRLLLALVNNSVVDGWNDPRMPTICGLRRRGVPAVAIRKFCEIIGVTRNNSTVDQAKFDDVIREELDSSCPRRFAAINPIKVTLTDYPEGKTESFEVPNHPKDASFGTRSLKFSRTFYIDGGDFMENPTEDYFRLSPGGEAMLRAVGIVIKVTEFKKDDKGKVVELLCTHTPAGEKKVQGHIGWVSGEDSVKATVHLLNELFLPEKEEEEAAGNEDEVDEGEAEDSTARAEEKKQKMLSLVNPESKITCTAMVEAELASAKLEDRFQFERLGFFVADWTNTKDLTFNRIITLRASGPEKVQGRSRKAQQEEQLRLKKLIDSLPAEEMFKAQTDKYSKFDAEGVPTHDETGKELSKGAVKKLKKEWEKKKKAMEK